MISAFCIWGILHGERALHRMSQTSRTYGLAASSNALPRNQLSVVHPEANESHEKNDCKEKDYEGRFRMIHLPNLASLTMMQVDFYGFRSRLIEMNRRGPGTEGGHLAFALKMYCVIG